MLNADRLSNKHLYKIAWHWTLSSIHCRCTIGKDINRRYAT